MRVSMVARILNGKEKGNSLRLECVRNEDMLRPVKIYI